MKVLVLFSLVALCAATQVYSGKRVTVGEDGTVTIIGTQGKEIYISKNIYNPRKVDIILRSPMGYTRKVEVDETNNMMDVNVNTLDKIRYLQHSTYLNIPREQITQADILAHLFRQYEGIIEEPTFQMILDHVQTLVRSGLVHESVYDVLKNLEHLYMIEELKRGYHSMDVMEDVLPRMITGDVTYPLESGLVHEVRDVTPVEEIVPEYLRTLLYKYKTFGLQGLWNAEHLTPYQRMEILLQHIRQQRQMEETLGETITEKVLSQELAHEKLMEELYKQQTEMTPLTRFMYNMKQGYNNKYTQQEPQVQVMGFQKLIQKLKWSKVVPQQWTQQWMQTDVPQQWMQTEDVPQQWTYGQLVPQQWTQRQVLPQQWTYGQVVPQQWTQGQVVPQQWTQGQVAPQQVLNHLVGLERMMEQGQILPQEYNMLKQYYQRMMM